jgi:hypothetical protein
MHLDERALYVIPPADTLSPFLLTQPAPHHGFKSMAMLHRNEGFPDTAAAAATRAEALNSPSLSKLDAEARALREAEMKQSLSDILKWTVCFTMCRAVSCWAVLEKHRGVVSDHNFIPTVAVNFRDRCIGCGARQAKHVIYSSRCQPSLTRYVSRRATCVRQSPSYSSLGRRLFLPLLMPPRECACP